MTPKEKYTNYKVLETYDEGIIWLTRGGYHRAIRINGEEKVFHNYAKAYNFIMGVDESKL
jgi:hypothetical protein